MTIVELRHIVLEKDTYIKNYLEFLYNHCTQKLLAVYAVFKNYFGEDFVDLQSCDQLEHFTYIIFNNELASLITEDIKNIGNLRKYNLEYLITIREKFATKKIYELPFHYLKLFEKNPITVVNNLYALFTTFLNEAINNRNSDIIVYFPKVKVTNEYDKFVYIEDLWVKVNVKHDGKLSGTFRLNRSTYTTLQFRNDYMHSHINHIPINAGNSFTVFQEPCLGRGPIMNTVTTLCTKPSINIWKLFCVELDTYVKVESIEGVPWKSLERLLRNNPQPDASIFSIPNTLLIRIDYPRIAEKMEDSQKLWEDFIKFFIRKRVLMFKYVNSYYTIAMSYVEYMVAISNAFIEWYNLILNSNAEIKPFSDNTELICRQIITIGIIKNGRIYRELGTRRPCITDYSQYIGEKVLDFKGKPITLNIYEDITADNENCFLERQISLTILKQILNIINYRYGTKNNKQEETKRYELAVISRTRDTNKEIFQDSSSASEESVWYI